MAMRQERRALLRQAVKEVTARGISPRQGIWGTIGATRILLDVLEGGSQQRASETARRALEIFDLSVKRNPPEAPLACARGCAFCCHSFVTATAPEVFLLARTIRTANKDLGPVLERVRATIAAIAGLDKVQRFATRQACSMLVANECSAYAGRPMSCRAFASFSMQRCEQAFETGSEDIPTPAIHAFLRRACRQALWSGLAAKGLILHRLRTQSGAADRARAPRCGGAVACGRGCIRRDRRGRGYEHVERANRSALSGGDRRRCHGAIPASK